MQGICRIRGKGPGSPHRTSRTISCFVTSPSCSRIIRQSRSRPVLKAIQCACW
eukprot:jgi/Botrbrau1/19959/Bobra.0059s0075.1